MRILLIPLLLIALLALPAWAERASEDEAWLVAQNWVDLIIHKKGDWGGAKSATVTGVEPFVRDGRVVGYLCYVSPQGFILTSTLRELTPVKAYSAQSTLNPDCPGGLTDLLGTRMQQTLAHVEKVADAPAELLTSGELAAILNQDRRSAWDVLTDARFNPAALGTKLLRSGSKGMNYEEGEILCTSNWHQKPPYNDQCPDGGCDWSGPPFHSYNTNKLVGCVATAGAQIMRYWCWPPCNMHGNYVDAYRWSNMPDYVNIYSPQDEIDCSAAASRMVADGVGMSFGCSESSSNTYDMDGVYENRRYDTILGYYRDDFSAEQWFAELKDEFDHNRVVHYRVEGHSIVGDGWQEIDLGGGNILKQYHMNYGWWGTADDTWYELDNLNLGGFHEEYYLFNIRPLPLIPFTAFGTFDASGMGGNHYDRPRRYFVLDTQLSGATFEPGQCLQYVRTGFWLRATNGSSEIQGAPGLETLIHHRAPDHDVRIRVLDGAVKFHAGGEIVFH